MKILQGALLLAVLASSTANAEGILGNILRQSLEESQARHQQKVAAVQARQELLATINQQIRTQPNVACALPKAWIEKWTDDNIEKGDLLSAVKKTVFYEDDSPSPQLDGYQAYLETLRAENRRIQAANKAIQEGGLAPVGDQLVEARPDHHIFIDDIKATSRIENGLSCSAEVWAAKLRLYFIYTIVPAADDPDGWTGQLNAPEFTEAFALAHPDRIKVRYNDENMSLADARMLAAKSRASVAEANRRAEAAVPRKSPAAYRACQAIEGDVKKIIEGNSGGSVKVIEVSTYENAAGARSDGTISCGGVVITNRGRIEGHYGTSRSPKGQLLIEWQPY